MFLPFGTGIFGMSLAVESAFVADTDTFFVEATGVCADAFERSGRFDIPKIPVPNGRNIRCVC